MAERKVCTLGRGKGSCIGTYLTLWRGAFEGIRFYSTDQGPAIFRLIDHVDRLLYSAATLKMQLPFSKEEIISAIKEVVRNSNLDAGYIRPIAFMGTVKWG